MIKTLKKNKKFSIDAQIINTLMKNGKKKTSEKIILKFVKLLQKSTNKNFKEIFWLSLINSTFTFKVKEQKIKKGKRKIIKVVPVFIINNSLRIASALKIIKEKAIKDGIKSKFYKSFVKEILALVVSKNSVRGKKNNYLQTQLLSNKRYLSKFRW